MQKLEKQALKKCFKCCKIKIGIEKFNLHIKILGLICSARLTLALISFFGTAIMASFAAARPIANDDFDKIFSTRRAAI